MSYLPQIIFLIIIAFASWILWKRVSSIRSNILMGRPIDRSDRKSERFKQMLLVAFGQKKMFKKLVPAILHLFLYVGFLVINLEVLEFVIDGLFGTHRIFAPYLGSLYAIPMNIFEFLALAVIVSCLIFLFRRNVLKLRRFHAQEMTSWPKLDANLILIIEILLMTAIMTMNSVDQVLQTRVEAGYTETGTMFFSSLLMPLFENFDTANLIVIERVSWWLHIIGILAFGVYVTYSKHLHIAMAFPNTYYASLKPKTEMSNMPEVTNEVNMMLGINTENNTNEPPGEIARFGAKDVNDLHWKNLMDAYTCTECGRCTSVCPANMTGKLLSPRKIMMDTRDRLVEVGKYQEANSAESDDGKSLLDDYISREEIWACTTCNACVEACPVNINPLEIITELRRYAIMEESQAPASINAMFGNIENNGAPWKYSQADRANWTDQA